MPIKITQQQNCSSFNKFSIILSTTITPNFILLSYQNTSLHLSQLHNELTFRHLGLGFINNVIRQFLLQNRKKFFLLKIIVFHMPNNSLYLFEEVLPTNISLLQELQRPRLRNIFTINKQDVQLTLTNHHIVLSQTHNFRHPTHHLQLNFDTKYEILYQNSTQDFIGIPFSIKLEREGCIQQLVFSAIPIIIEVWALELQKNINHKGFHKLFKAKRKIGKGAFATVYLAQRLRDKKMVAVKAFSKQKQFSGDKGKQSLQNEIKLMRRLNHPNIMHLEGVYQTQNSIYVILEYLQGMQLNNLLKNPTSISPHDAKSIIKSLLTGLFHLSRCRIIHRDLKPQNLMFKKEKSWEISICDFGLATYADEEKYLFVRCGTPGFVAPQIINIRDMNTKSEPISDVFSAGVIFHFLLLGYSVFQGKKYNQILNQNRACDFTFKKEIYSKVPSKTLDLLSKMLEKDPKKRISAQEALDHPYFYQMDLQTINDGKIPMREFFSPRNKMMPEIPPNKSNKMNEKVQLESYRSQELRQNPYLF